MTKKFSVPAVEPMATVGTGVNSGISTVVGVADGDTASTVAGMGVAVGRTVVNVGVISGASVTVTIGNVGVGVSVGCSGASVGVGGVGVG